MSKVSRRSFLAGATAAAIGTALQLRGQFSAKWRRRNVADPEAACHLGTYREAVSRLLALPPTDPRNWYRLAFIHVLDCPHGNWWFLPWHRGYIGWFEQICRDITGDQSFALPYWDWTTQQRIPAPFFESVLNPRNAPFIDSFAKFKSTFEKPMDDYWVNLPFAERFEINARGYMSMDAVWNAILGGDMFPAPADAREFTFEKPTFVRKELLDAIEEQMIAKALAPTEFMNFGSHEATSHHSSNGLQMLEGQPHNNIHNAIGGFMRGMLSPVDPIFYLHHCNIDRLWDVWERKQRRQKTPLPTWPLQRTDRWRDEPFLFFVDGAGKPVTRRRAQDYETIGAFAYDYQPGAGETVIPEGMKKAPVLPRPIRPIPGTVTQAAISLFQTAVGVVNVPPTLLTESNRLGRNLSATLTLVPPADTRNVRLHVFLNPPQDPRTLDADHPSWVTSIVFFGHDPHAHGAMPFMIPISDALSRLGRSTRQTTQLRFLIVARPDDPQESATADGQLTRISVGSF